MGADVELYRAAIGAFYFKVRRIAIGYVFNFENESFTGLFTTNLTCSFLFAALVFIQGLNPNVNVFFTLFVIFSLLQIGNVELNPGPESTNSSSDTHTLSICNLNIRSVRNKINFIENFLSDFDILALTETHLDEQVRDEDINVETFSNKILRKDRTNHGGGLLIYSKDELCLTWL